MLGLIQSHQLLVSGLLEHAAINHGDTEIVSYTLEEGCLRYDYASAESRARKLAKAMLSLGVTPGDRVGTLAWNTHRHLELFFAIPGIEGVCHTINPRLFDEQLLYIINHAEDRFIFLDTSFVELAERLAPDLTSVEGWVIMTDEAHMPDTSLPNTHCYETLVNQQTDEFSWPQFDEKNASSLCYTSGTTGDPKGVLYANRSTIIHTLAAMQPDVHDISSQGTIMPVAPMFHANSWGVPYCAAAAGTKLVLMGRDVGGENIARVIDEEGVTYALAVPTVWLDYLIHVEGHDKPNPTFVKVGIGGTAPPRSMYERFAARGVEVRQGWGMTEMSPLGTFGSLKGNQMDLDDEAKLDIQVRQ
jgi:acyl-CoA synthetase (AMP-forming)/AMP-acid ligase II